MIELIKITTSNPNYEFVEELLHSSFPDNERRDDALQRDNTDNNEKFSTLLISDNGENIGVITIWHLNGFCYVEHLATSPSVRNKGYGSKIIFALTEMINGMIVLEVELPEDEMSRRRIGFYERCGFRLCHKPYFQPPYRKGDEKLPMHIMFSGKEEVDNEFENIKSEIYSNVYNWCE